MILNQIWHILGPFFGHMTLGTKYNSHITAFVIIVIALPIEENQNIVNWGNSRSSNSCFWIRISRNFCCYKKYYCRIVQFYNNNNNKLIHQFIIFVTKFSWNCTTGVIFDPVLSQNQLVFRENWSYLFKGMVLTYALYGAWAPRDQSLGPLGWDFQDRNRN